MKPLTLSAKTVGRRLSKCFCPPPLDCCCLCAVSGDLTFTVCVLLQENVNVTGWDWWKDVFRFWRADPTTPTTAETWALETSTLAGKDLSGFYKQWFWPVLAATVSNIATLALGNFTFDAKSESGASGDSGNSTGIIWPLPEAATPITTQDWVNITQDIKPNLDVIFDNVLKATSNMLIYGTGVAALPGCVLAMGRAGLARAVALPDYALLTAYKQSSLWWGSEAMIARNAIWWAANGDMLPDVRIGVAPGSVLADATLWQAYTQMAAVGGVLLVVCHLAGAVFEPCSEALNYTSNVAACWCYSRCNIVCLQWLQ